jgi:alpha-tubulin suppressor-like RCC1 family protein
VDAEAGFHHSLVLRRNGTVWGSGENTFGQLGDGTTTEHRIPVRASDISNVVDLSSSYNHSLAVAAPPEQ